MLTLGLGYTSRRSSYKMLEGGRVDKDGVKLSGVALRRHWGEDTELGEHGIGTS